MAQLHEPRLKAFAKVVIVINSFLKIDPRLHPGILGADLGPGLSRHARVVGL